MLKIVYTNGCEVHENSNKYHEKDKLFFGKFKGIFEVLDGTVILHDSQYSENAQYAECPYGNKTKSMMEIKGKYGNEIYETEKTKNVFQGSGGRINPQDIFHRKNEYKYNIGGM